jgi:hypothetical protein
MLASRAEQVALQWFAALANEEPQIAQQLSSPAGLRAHLSDPAKLWTYYRNSADRRRELERFVNDRLVRTLLALDGASKVRLYSTNVTVVDEQHAVVGQTYSVTYDDGGARKTFFVKLTLERSTQRGSDKIDWRVMSYVGGVEPE